jgi:hypothetical protein
MPIGYVPFFADSAILKGLYEVAAAVYAVLGVIIENLPKLMPVFDLGSF